MRDIRRIDRILEVLGDYWKLVPDWRLGQLISNVFGNNDIFYLEDENFIASIVSEDKISVKINDNFVGKSSIKVNIDGWETEKFISLLSQIFENDEKVITELSDEEIYNIFSLGNS